MWQIWQILAWKCHRTSPYTFIHLWTLNKFYTCRKKRTKDKCNRKRKDFRIKKKIQSNQIQPFLETQTAKFTRLHFILGVAIAPHCFPVISSHHSSLSLVFQSCFQLIFNGFWSWAIFNPLFSSIGIGLMQITPGPFPRHANCLLKISACLSLCSRRSLNCYNTCTFLRNQNTQSAVG